MSDLSRLSHYPIGASLTLAELEENVHPTLHRLRASEPVSWVPVLNGWLITRYDDAIHVMRDAKTYTVDHPGFSTAQVVGPSMLSLDGHTHRKHRGPFEKPFRRSEVEKRFNDKVAIYIKELLNDLVGSGSTELRREYAGPIAVQAMILALGLEYAEASISVILGWYDTIVEAVTRVTAGEPVSAEGRAAFSALRETLLPVLRDESEASLLAAASGMAQGLSDDEIISNAAVLLFGGIETTEGMIANAFYFLLTNPEMIQIARSDASLLPAIVEESLRLEPAATVVDRYAIHDVQLGKALIKEGDLIHISLAGANRDPVIFDDPDRFDPLRTTLRSHVAFAQGPHVCLGLHLARLEAIYALEQALARLPNLRLENTDEAQHAAQPRGLVFRKPPALYVRWDV